MDLQQLRYIVALNEERNFLKAAKKTNVTQPTLSQQVKKLEEELGSPLFERSNQYVQLTDAGRKFLPHAVSILDTLEKGIALVRNDQDEIRGTVKLAAIPTVAPYVLPSAILLLKKKAPLLKLELHEETTSVLLSHLKDGALDLGLLALPVDVPGIVVREVGREDFWLAVGRRHPLAKKKKIGIADIRAEKLLILQEGHCFGDQFLEYCRKSREDEQIIFQGSSLASVLKLAAAGDGITLVPKMAVEPRSYPDLVFLPVSEPRPSRGLALVWRVSAPMTRAVRTVYEAVENSVREKLGQEPRP